VAGEPVPVGCHAFAVPVEPPPAPRPANWDALHGAQLPLCGGERRILTLASSIAAGLPAYLRDTLPGLDDRNLRLVITAIRHAAGQRPRHR